MSNTKDRSEVTFQKGRGPFKIYCGKYAGEDGKLRPTIHWLGHDETHAKFSAFTIRKAWAAHERAGLDRWHRDELDAAREKIVHCALMYRELLERIETSRNGLDCQEQFPNRDASFVAPTRTVQPAPVAANHSRHIVTKIKSNFQY